MEDYREFRKAERIDFGTPVVFSDIQQQNHHHAVMHNFSDNGMYFESSEPLRTGSKINVKTLEFPSINKCEVKWCGRIYNNDEEMFGIGLQCEI